MASLQTWVKFKLPMVSTVEWGPMSADAESYGLEFQQRDRVPWRQTLVGVRKIAV